MARMLIAGLILALPSAVFADGPRAMDAGAMPAGPSGAPTTTVSPTPTIPGMGGVTTTGLSATGANTGVTVANSAAGANARGASAVPPAGAAAIGAPTAAEAEARAAGATSSKAPAALAADAAGGRSELSSHSAAADPGAAVMTPAGDKQGAAAPRGLNGLSSELKRAQALEAKGADGSTAQALDKVFDSARATGRRVGGAAPGAVAGKTELVQDRVRQTARVADTASPHDAPALYKDAIRIAEEAALQKTLARETAQAVADVVIGRAFKRAERALPQLAGEAYKAAQAGPAGKSAVEKVFRSLGAWDKLLGGGPSKPLILNAGELRADVDRTLAQASGPQARRGNGVAPRVSFRREGDAFVAELAARTNAASADALRLPEGFLAGLSLDGKKLGADMAPSPVLDGRAGLLSGTRLIYATHRRAGRSAPAAAAAAASFAARSAARSFWETLTGLVAAAVGRVAPGRVDLGAGQSLVSSDRALSRLSALRREPTEEERRALASARPGAALVFVDLGSVERSSAEALRAASRGAETAGQLKALFALLDAQAARYAQLTGDGSAQAAAASLRARLAADLSQPDAAALGDDARALAAPETSGGLAYWLSRLPQATLDHLDRQMLGAARRGGLAAVAYADLAAGTARIVARSPSPAVVAELEGLGFEVELGAGGAARARASGPGLAARLDQALDRLASRPAPAAADGVVGRAAAFAAQKPEEARREAERLLAEDPTLSGFSPAGIVRGQGRPLWAETALRREGGRLSRVVILRDLDTRRPLFGRAEPLPR